MRCPATCSDWPARRNPDRVIERYGQDAYRTAEASLQWGLHQFLGRLVPVIYVLTAASSR